MKSDDRVDEARPAKGAGSMERFALHEFEPEARQRLPHAVYEYVAEGAGEYSIRANQESYQTFLATAAASTSSTTIFFFFFLLQLFVLSSNGTVSIEEVHSGTRARCWFQIYVQGDRGFTRDSIARVEAAGCEAVCVTVDTPVLGITPPPTASRIEHSGPTFPCPTPHACEPRRTPDGTAR